MARLAFAGSDAYSNGRIEVSDYEMARAGKSYTFYTLEHFSSDRRQLFLLVGTDMFLTLGGWFRAADIFTLADIVLMRRECDKENLPLIMEKAAEYESLFGARIHIIDEPPIVVSSTELRGDIRDCVDTDGLIPEAVAKYIEEKGLYRKNDE